MKPIPKISDLYNSISNDLKSKLGIKNLILKTVLNAFASVMAAQFKLMYLFLSDIQNNIFPDTADTELNGGTLERIGRIQLNRNPFPATVGVFRFQVTGVIGSELRSGLTFKSNENAKNTGKLYVIDSSYTLSSTTDFIECRAFGGGLDFDLNIDDELTITEPVIGVDKTVVVSEILEAPKEAESLDSYRKKIIDSIQLEPQGGSKTDYRLWSLDAQGVSQVYPYVKQTNSGVVQIFVEATEIDSIDGLGTPSSLLLIDVADVIEQDPDISKPIYERGRRPIQAIIEVLPITTIPVDVLITGLNDSSVAVKNLIKKSVENFLKTVRPYVSGSDLVSNKNNILYYARLQSEVSNAISKSNYFQDFTMVVNGNNVNSYNFDFGNIPYLRNINYV